VAGRLEEIMGSRPGVKALGVAAVLAGIALVGSGFLPEGTAGSGGAAGIAVASSIRGGDSLSGQVRWSAEVSGLESSPATIARVVFTIDGVVRWSDQMPPYVFNGDLGLLDIRRLLAGPHTFVVRAYSVGGVVAADSVVANAADGVRQLHSNFEQPGRIVPFNAFEYHGSFEPGLPIDHQLAWVSSPVRRGRHALRFTVHSGDRFGESSGERALLRYTDQLSFDGADQYFSWSTLFPEDWAPPKWGLIFELHGDSRFRLAPIRLNARHNSLALDMTTGTCTGSGSCSYDRKFPVLSTLSKGRWNDFVVRIRFAKRDQGIVEICHHLAGEGRWRMALKLRHLPTLPFYRDQGDSTMYLLWGLYTGEGRSTRVLYGDNFTFSTRLGDIAASLPRLPPTCRFTPTLPPRR
jgi:Polysaccharide lyase